MRKSKKKIRLKKFGFVLLLLIVFIYTIIFLINKLNKVDETAIEKQDTLSEIVNDFDERNSIEQHEEYDNSIEKLIEEKSNSENGQIDKDNVSNDRDRVVNSGETSFEPVILRVVAKGDYLLALVTKETTLKREYAPSDLSLIPDDLNPAYEMYLREEALTWLKALWYRAKAEGVVLHIRSAYRSYNTQQSLFQDYVSRYGEAEANRFSARPGQSEHQLGTTVDFGGTPDDFTEAFSESKQGLWLAENAYKYGFALSYPRNKEHVTGYIFEPWHYRYIGVDAALEWKYSGKILKDFLESKPQEFLDKVE